MKRSAQNMLFPTAVLFATAAASVAFSDDAGTADVTETLVHAQYDDTWRRSESGHHPYEDSYSYTIEINKPFATNAVLDHARQQDALSHQDSVAMLDTTGLSLFRDGRFPFHGKRRQHRRAVTLGSGHQRAKIPCGKENPERNVHARLGFAVKPPLSFGIFRAYD